VCTYAVPDTERDTGARAPLDRSQYRCLFPVMWWVRAAVDASNTAGDGATGGAWRRDRHAQLPEGERGSSFRRERHGTAASMAREPEDSRTVMSTSGGKLWRECWLPLIGNGFILNPIRTMEIN
jgi:hypothetical protein